MIRQASATRSRAVEVALAHIEAWSHRNYEEVKKKLADDVHSTVTTTQPTMPGTDTVGVDKYMSGLKKFGEIVVPGSVRIMASSGDDRNALVMVEMKVALGPGAPDVPLVGGRLYLVDEAGKVSAEQVIFTVLSP